MSSCCYSTVFANEIRVLPKQFSVFQCKLMLSTQVWGCWQFMKASKMKPQFVGSVSNFQLLVVTERQPELSFQNQIILKEKKTPQSNHHKQNNPKKGLPCCKDSRLIVQSSVDVDRQAAKTYTSILKGLTTFRKSLPF